MARVPQRRQRVSASAPDRRNGYRSRFRVRQRIGSGAPQPRPRPRPRPRRATNGGDGRRVALRGGAGAVARVCDGHASGLHLHYPLSFADDTIARRRVPVSVSDANAWDADAGADHVDADADADADPNAGTDADLLGAEADTADTALTDLPMRDREFGQTESGQCGDLRTEPTALSLVAAFDQWIGAAKGWSRDAALVARLVTAYETTRDALRNALERQRVFRDALRAVLSEALRPASREVCALVSAYVLAPAPIAPVVSRTAAVVSGVPTPTQRDAMAWIASSAYGKQYEWAAQHVLLPAGQTRLQFNAAAAFASALERYCHPSHQPADDTARCVLDAFLRHGLQLNACLGEQFNATVAAASAMGVTDRDERATIASFVRTDRDVGAHVPLSLSLGGCEAMSRALLALPASCGVDVRAPPAGSPSYLRALCDMPDDSDARVVCTVVRRSDPDAVARWPVFTRCVEALGPDYAWGNMATAQPATVRYAQRQHDVVQALVRTCATDDGHNGGLDLHSPPRPYRSSRAARAPSAVAAIAQWIDDAADRTRGNPLGAQLVAAYTVTHDVLRDALERQRVFRDALPAVLSEALRPVPREVCALVSAYVLWPVPMSDAHTDDDTDADGRADADEDADTE